MKFLFVLASACLLGAPAAQAATQYTYDALNRLTKVVYDDGRSISYTYDAAGNMLTKTQSAGSGWCGQTLTFNNNKLPSNWSSFLIRRGPGLQNERMEAAPTDSGVVINSTGIAMDPAVKTVVIEFNNSRSESYWGQFNTLEFKTSGGKYWGFGDANFVYRSGSREFTAYRNTSAYGSNIAGVGEYYQKTSAPMGSGLFKTRVTLKAGSAQWLITDSAGAVTTINMALPAEFKIAELVAATASVYTTTDGAAWIDDLAFQCLP